mmetsp:Transcript_11324/g.22390  ORF Transcript_11324/g.22390 Transcript_11324/m.22390 type:complete len:407 (-) Transcript_11324:120-1340(-)
MQLPPQDHVDRLHQLPPGVQAVQMGGQIREAVPLRHPRSREGGQDRVQVVVVLRQQGAEFLRVAQGRVHAHADTGRGGVRGVAHDQQPVLGIVVFVTVHHGGAVPATVRDPFFRKVVVIRQLEGFEMGAEIGRHNFGIVRTQIWRDFVEVVGRNSDGDVDQVVGHGKTDPVHVGETVGQQRHAGGFQGLRQGDVHGPEVIEDVPDVHFEIVRTLDKRLPDDGAGAIGPDQQVVVEIALLAVVVHAPHEGTALLVIHVHHVGPVAARQQGIVPMLNVHEASYGRDDEVSVHNVTLRSAGTFSSKIIHRALHLLRPQNEGQVLQFHAHVRLLHVCVIQLRNLPEGIEAVSGEADHPRTITLQLRLDVQETDVDAGIEEGHVVFRTAGRRLLVALQEETCKKETRWTGS